MRSIQHKLSSAKNNLNALQSNLDDYLCQRLSFDELRTRWIAALSDNPNLRAAALRLLYRRPLRDHLEDGKILMPYFQLTNDEGVIMFSSIDQELRWQTEPRKIGRYVSTAWIPGNTLSEGMVYVLVAMRTKRRNYRPIEVRDAVAFNVVDKMEEGSARGLWVGRLHGVVRPKLEWKTEFYVGDEAVGE